MNLLFHKQEESKKKEQLFPNNSRITQNGGLEEKIQVFR